MARNVINYELFTSKKEELRAIEKKKQKNRRMKWAAGAIVLLFALLILYMIQQSRCEYYIYKEEVKTEENGGVTYDTFSDGYLKYSSYGIEYQKPYGMARWNVALSFSKPFLAMSDQYVLLGDKGGNKAILFDESGMVQEYTMKYPIIQLDVSDNGNVVAILQKDDVNYIYIYSKDGTQIADTRITVDDTGYPVTAAISPDGSKLAVSFYVVEELSGKSRMAFYDFSQQVSQETNPLTGGLDYEGTLIPKLEFLSNDRLLAYGADTSYYYDLSDTPRELKKIHFDSQIESVFSGAHYFGYVCDNVDSSEGRFRIYLYNHRCQKKMETTLDMSYNDIKLIGDDIVATRDNELTIINKHGKILFQGELDGGNIENVLPCFGWRTYRIVFSDKIVKMQLSFFNADAIIGTEK